MTPLPAGTRLSAMSTSVPSSPLAPLRPRSQVTVGLTVGLLALSTGCRGSGIQPAGQVVDSAGVRIVSYDLTGVSVPTYRAMGPRDLEIGAQDGPPEYTFSQVTDLAVGEDRSIIVSDAVAREVRVFSAGGTYQGTVGRRGEGPGEFQAAPMFADLSGDTLFTFDARARRVSAFLATGKFVSGTSLWADGAGFTTSLLRLDDGSYMSQSNWVNPETADAVYDLRLDFDSVVVEHLGADAAVLDTIRLLGDRNRARSVEGLAGGRFRTRQITTPYSPRAVVAVDCWALRRLHSRVGPSDRGLGDGCPGVGCPASGDCQGPPSPRRSDSS